MDFCFFLVFLLAFLSKRGLILRVVSFIWGIYLIIVHLDNSSKKSPEKKPKSQIQIRQCRISGKVKRRDVEKASENSEVTCQETPTEVD